MVWLSKRGAAAFGPSRRWGRWRRPPVRLLGGWCLRSVRVFRRAEWRTANRPHIRESSNRRWRNPSKATTFRRSAKSSMPNCAGSVDCVAKSNSEPCHLCSSQPLPHLPSLKNHFEGKSCITSIVNIGVLHVTCRTNSIRFHQVYRSWLW